MVCFKLGDFLGDQMLPVCILWDHTDIFFLQFLTSFCSLTLVVRELSFKHLYVPQNKKMTYPKIPTKGSKQRHGGVSQHSKRAVLNWMDYYEAAMICSYRANAFPVDLSQRHANARQNWYWRLLSMLQDLWRLHILVRILHAAISCVQL